MSDSKSPHRSRYSAKVERRAPELEKETQAMRQARVPTLNSDQVQPLPPAERLQSNDSHDGTVAGWKSLFKVGDVHLVGGVKLKVTHIGKRGITLRRSH